LPSTPLLVPEFSNPLFLKILCESLREKGEHRLPRGFQGITKLFEFLLDSVNHRLALKLDFDLKENLVPQAVNHLAKKFAEQGKRWLPRNEAKEIVDSFLPGREFSRSLFHGLLAEGILLEGLRKKNDEEYEDIILISYERFTDHLIAKYLLDQYLNQEKPEESFQQGGPLGFLWNPEHHVPPGLLEALCIQVPECTGRELLEFIPSLKPESVTSLNPYLTLRGNGAICTPFFYPLSLIGPSFPFLTPKPPSFSPRFLPLSAFSGTPPLRHSFTISAFFLPYANASRLYTCLKARYPGLHLPNLSL